MKTTTHYDVNSIKNQKIKSKFIERDVYCNVNTLVEYCLKMGDEDRDAPFTFEDIENLYTYPEWNKKVVGEDLFFAGGTEDDKNTFLENFDRLIEESEELLSNEEISEVTHERNVELINEAKDEYERATEDNEAQEIYEWWAVSSWLYDKLKQQGECVLDAGSCYVWGRGTTGQAILLDDVISNICSDLEILEGQKNEWK